MRKLIYEPRSKIKTDTGGSFVAETFALGYRRSTPRKTIHFHDPIVLFFHSEEKRSIIPLLCIPVYINIYYSIP